MFVVLHSALDNEARESKVKEIISRHVNFEEPQVEDEILKNLPGDPLRITFRCTGGRNT